MDKHERPYVCTVPGCEKVQGFTYSGGLLRHEREVHGKHGGPKNAMFCPHPTCKRSGGKGFSRTENLQEHLRRVHTTGATAAAVAATTTNTTTTTTTTTTEAQQLLQSPEEPQHSQMPSPESTSDMASAAFAFIHSTSKSPNDSLAVLHDHDHDDIGERGSSHSNGHKRKRSEDDDGENRRNLQADFAAMQGEVKKLREENEELRQQLLEQTRHAEDMRTQLQAVNAAISQTLAAPQPPVL